VTDLMEFRFSSESRGPRHAKVIDSAMEVLLDPRLIHAEDLLWRHVRGQADGLAVNSAMYLESAANLICDCMYDRSLRLCSEDDCTFVGAVGLLVVTLDDLLLRLTRGDHGPRNLWITRARGALAQLQGMLDERRWQSLSNLVDLLLDEVFPLFWTPI
jgi:hypothetical protein